MTNETPMHPEDIQRACAEILPQLIEMRRHLHANPELSFQEKETSAFVSEKLRALGIEHKTNIGGYGIHATITGGIPGDRRVALRADMDALPIHEKNTCSYRSKKDGIMHACGHDVHTTSLLGAAMLLKTFQDRWSGHVDLIFQPAEEVIPGGAKLMLDDGLFAENAPHFVFGQHVYPELPAGMVGVRSGAYMASTDELYITVNGRGGHGAQPNVTIDPVVISAHIILALQHIPSRCAHPSMPTVLSIGKVIAEGATNVIPSSVRMEGTFRTFDESWRTRAHELIRDTVIGIAQSMRAEAEIEIRRGYPVLNNDEDATARFTQRAVEYLGADHVVELDQRATAEDFAYYGQKFPACFYRFGTSSPDSENFRFNIHHPQFDIDENSLLTSAGLMAWIGMHA